MVMTKAPEHSRDEESQPLKGFAEKVQVQLLPLGWLLKESGCWLLRLLIHWCVLSPDGRPRMLCTDVDACIHLTESLNYRKLNGNSYYGSILCLSHATFSPEKTLEILLAKKVREMSISTEINSSDEMWVFFTFILCIYFVYEGGHICHSLCVEVREQLSGAGSLLSLCGFWR